MTLDEIKEIQALQSGAVIDVTQKMIKLYSSIIVHVLVGLKSGNLLMDFELDDGTMVQKKLEEVLRTLM